MTAGRRLADHGHRVELFDKARGPGGRTATRRSDDRSFDHGAQYFTVRDPDFADQVSRWQQAGVVAEWQGRIAVAEQGIVTAKTDNPPRYVGVPAMNAMVKHLADGLSLYRSTRIVESQHDGQHWQLTAEHGQRFDGYQGLIVAVPPLQAMPLIGADPELVRQVETVTMKPCWSVMVGFDKPLPIAADGLFCQHSALSWIARNSSKPGRPAPEAWMLHATPEWSAQHLEEDADRIAEILLAELFAITGCPSQTPDHLQAHRWRYSIAEQPLEQGCLWQPSVRLGVCGDWCAGSRVEGAFISGRSLADRLIEQLG